MGKPDVDLPEGLAPCRAGAKMGADEQDLRFGRTEGHHRLVARDNNRRWEDVMKLRNRLQATAGMAFTMGVAGALMAQNKPAGAEPGATGAAAAPQTHTRHLLFIALPGGSGADDQSGLVVLDADHDYRYVK